MQEIVKMVDILKVYPNGIVANQKVNFSIVEGEIHALVGENGAGKSTLMKILFGIEQPTEGKIILNGQEVKFANPDTFNEVMSLYAQSSSFRLGNPEQFSVVKLLL